MGIDTMTVKRRIEVYLRHSCIMLAFLAPFACIAQPLEPVIIKDGFVKIVQSPGNYMWHELDSILYFATRDASYKAIMAYRTSHGTTLDTAYAYEEILPVLNTTKFIKLTRVPMRGQPIDKRYLLVSKDAIMSFQLDKRRSLTRIVLDTVRDRPVTIYVSETPDMILELFSK